MFFENTTIGLQNAHWAYSEPIEDKVLIVSQVSSFYNGNKVIYKFQNFKLEQPQIWYKIFGAGLYMTEADLYCPQKQNQAYRAFVYEINCIGDNEREIRFMSL